MGRAMLIFSAGAVIVLGIIQVGIQSQRSAISQNSIVTANNVEIRNKAYTAVQLAMERINTSNGSWHPQKNSPWIEAIAGDSISLYYTVHPPSTPGVGAFAYLDEDTVVIHAKSWYSSNNNQRKEIEIITSYKKSAMHFVPEFKSAMSFATDDFTLSAGGNSHISGNDESGQCGGDRPAVTTISERKAQEVANSVGSEHLSSDSTNVAFDSNLSYQPVDELIARLAESQNTRYIQGNYKGDLGSETNPGVFFVENNAKLTGGISEGFGILVVRNNGFLGYELEGVELDIGGNFKFNGLVVFEDAYNLKGRGTPRINGSVLVGKKDENTSNIIDVDLSGNLRIQYNCDAEKYAQVASAKELKQNRYKHVSTYE